jgi:hypothetical protein
VAIVGDKILSRVNVISAGPLPALIHNLPKLCPHFTTRESAMQLISDSFEKGAQSRSEVVIVALTGIAGSGPFSWGGRG